MPGPKIREGGALVDAEQHLMGVHRVRQTVEPVMLHLAALEPAEGPLHRCLGVLIPGRVLHALVKGHGDVTAQIGLDLHGFLRAHKDPVPVDMAGEGDALLLDLPQRGQRKHLKATGVRQNRPIPIHKFMEAAHLPHHLVTGTEMQVVGVGQLDLAAHIFQIQRRNAALDGRLGTHIHKHRGLHRTAVGAGEFAPPGLPLCFQDLKHSHIPFRLLQMPLHYNIGYRNVQERYHPQKLAI